MASTQYSSLAILSDEFENKKIVSKLPHHVRWVEHVVEKSEFPSFGDFAEFVKIRAKVSNHPLWNAEEGASGKAKSLATGGKEDAPTKEAVQGPPVFNSFKTSGRCQRPVLRYKIYRRPLTAASTHRLQKAKL